MEDYSFEKRCNIIRENAIASGIITPDEKGFDELTEDVIFLMQTDNQLKYSVFHALITRKER
jgi:hypothetical protein